MTPNLHLWLIPLLPLAGAAINGFFGKRFSRQAVSTVALAFCGAAFAMALMVAARFHSLALPYMPSSWRTGFAPAIFRWTSAFISTSSRS